MAAYLDCPMIRKLLTVCGQLLLLLGIVCTLSAYAAGEDIANVTTALDIESTSEEAPSDTAATETETSVEAEPQNIPPAADPPVISGESTNNAQIETTPTPLKDNDIRQRINGIFSEIEGLQAVSVSVTQGVVTLAGETPNEKRRNKPLI